MAYSLVRRLVCCNLSSAAAVLVGASLTLSHDAAAFDTGPHFDITRDALTEEGFGEWAIQYVQVTNWLTDIHERHNANKIPQSGHTNFLVNVLINNKWKWPDQVIASADRSHFDETDEGFSTAADLAWEWDRLSWAVGRLARQARQSNDPEMLLTVLGISLHQVQDFYSHTNWLEPEGEPFRDGPGWAARGFGRTPTWFDVPPAVRNAEDLYAGGSPRVARIHGGWNADGNRNLSTANAKDWPGRPFYAEAHMASYFATRQWVRAVRAHVGDDAFWARAMNLARPPAGLGHDQVGALNISSATGHWQGQGEACHPSFDTLSCGDRSGPGGRLTDAFNAVNDYFSAGQTRSFQMFQRWVPFVNECSHKKNWLKRPGVDCVNGVVAGFAVPSSQAMQQGMRFIRLEITSMAEIDNLEPGGWADMFVRAGIGRQRFISGVIYGFDAFHFKPPHAPFTFLKAVRDGSRFDEPVTSIIARIRTGDVSLGGTNDSVYLRINDGKRFQLDKRLYDDFERGDHDTYSVPLDDAVRDGLRVGDIRYLQIEKARDGLAGGWRLTDAQVWVNDRLVAADAHIDRWIENNRLSYRLQSFQPVAPIGTALPVVMELWDLDGIGRGNNDHADINGLDMRRNEIVTYVPGPAPKNGIAKGGSRHGGRMGDGNRAQLTWRLSTLSPSTSPFPTGGGQPTTPAARPDLQVTAFDLNSVTVTNRGTAPAGPFAVSIDGLGTPITLPGLAPGASITRAVDVRACAVGTGGVPGAPIRATVDSLNQVAESDESNNSRALGPVFC